MLKITVDGDDAASGEQAIGNQSIFTLEKEKGSWTIDKVLFDGDIVKLKDNHYHAIWNSKSYNIEVIESNLSDKKFQILINGQLLTTTARDQFDLLLEGMGMHAKAVPKINNVKAPMPGLIQSISVGEGDMVSKGDTLLVLVAMKMENVIKSAGDGIVKSLKITAGEIVEKNQVMLEFQ